MPTFIPKVSSSFTGIDENPISEGAVWVTVTSQTAFKRLTNTAQPSNLAVDNGSRHTQTLPDNQYARAALTVTGTTGASVGIGLLVRVASAALTCYRFTIDHAAANNASFQRFNAGVGAVLVSWTTPFTDGDTFTLAIEKINNKQILYAYDKNLKLIQTFDDTAGAGSTSGSAGLGYSSTETNASVDNWEAGSFNSASTVPVYPLIWPLRNKLPISKFLVFQQRPRYTAWRPVPKKPILPWDFVDAPTEPAVIRQLKFSPISFVAPVIPTLQTSGGMSGLLILTLRKQLLLAQQHPRYTAGLPVNKLPKLPWQFVKQIFPSVVHARKPLPSIKLLISGVTYNSTGTPLSTSIVKLYFTTTDIVVSSTVSDSLGNYSFIGSPSTVYYLIAYKAGSPDVAGTTLNTVIATDPPLATPIYLDDPTVPDTAGGSGAFRVVGSAVIRRIDQ